MPLVQQQYPKPSTLADVIQQVKDAFDAMGDATPIMVGKKYIQNIGSAPRIVIVPETDGRVGPPIEQGDAASVSHGCMVLVRAAETGGDVDRFKRAYELGDRLIDCIGTAATGRIEWNAIGDGSPLDVDAYGAELVLQFTYRRAVRHDPKRWALSAASTNNAPAEPLVPPGAVGSVDGATYTVTPKDDQ